MTTGSSSVDSLSSNSYWSIQDLPSTETKKPTGGQILFSGRSNKSKMANRKGPIPVTPPVVPPPLLTITCNPTQSLFSKNNKSPSKAPVSLTPPKKRKQSPLEVIHIPPPPSNPPSPLTPNAEQLINDLLHTDGVQEPLIGYSIPADSPFAPEIKKEAEASDTLEIIEKDAPTKSMPVEAKVTVAAKSTSPVMGTVWHSVCPPTTSTTVTLPTSTSTCAIHGNMPPPPPPRPTTPVAQPLPRKKQSLASRLQKIKEADGQEHSPEQWKVMEAGIRKRVYGLDSVDPGTTRFVNTVGPENLPNPFTFTTD
jgi:hypothetical protein